MAVCRFVFLTEDLPEALLMLTGESGADRVPKRPAQAAMIHGVLHSTEPDGHGVTVGDGCIDRLRDDGVAIAALVDQCQQVPRRLEKCPRILQSALRFSAGDASPWTFANHRRGSAARGRKWERHPWPDSATTYPVRGHAVALRRPITGQSRRAIQPRLPHR